ncbi:MAG: glycosyltransferase [Sphingomonas sp.]|jgi:glycosyltransferase involved in cell wall biosynthesis
MSDRPLRVLTYLNSFNPGGVERVALRLIGAWRQDGVEAVLVMGSDKGAARGALGDTPYRLLHDNGHWLQRALALRILFQLPAIIRQERPDILFCAGNTYSWVALLMRLMMGRRCPPVVAKISNDLVRHDQRPLVRFGYHLWLRLQGQVIDHFVGMAPPMADEIMRYTGAGQGRVTIINDPALLIAEVDRLAETGSKRVLAENGRRFLAIGRLSPQKNLAVMLAAFARMAGRADRLTIVGEGPERPALEKQAAMLGIADQVAMPGYSDNLHPWLQSAETLVMSSDYEGVPAAIIEAIAANLTVVATDCSVSMAALTGNGQFGTLVPVGDVEALARAMSMATYDACRASAARAHAAEFTLESGSAQYLALMRRLAAERQALNLR